MAKIETPVEEPIWLRDAQKGDPHAFSRLVETYERPVYNLCFRMLGNAQDAEDAAQETFLRAYQSLRRYDASRSFSAWLLSIAAHFCIDQLRKQRFRITSVEDLPDGDLLEPSPGVETSLDRKQDRENIQRLLAILNPLDRAAIIMYYWYDFSYEEICENLSLSMSALKSRLHRSRRSLCEEWIRQHQSISNQQSESTTRSVNCLLERMVS